NPDTGTCRGDSGGPAYAREGGELRLLAILSSGFAGQCGVGWYTDYLRVLPWLEDATGVTLATMGAATPVPQGASHVSCALSESVRGHSQSTAVSLAALLLILRRGGRPRGPR